MPNLHYGIRTSGCLFLDADALAMKDPSKLLTNFPDQYDFGIVHFNSGVFVWRSTEKHCFGIYTMLANHDWHVSGDPTEQDLLYHYWMTREAKLVRHLPGHYNVRPHHVIVVPSFGPDHIRNATVIHWIGNPKPWSAVLGQKTSIRGYSPQHKQPLWSSVLYQKAMYHTLTGFCPKNIDLLQGLDFTRGKGGKNP
mmetsp:Transcript_14220/g.25697  ORF Transcript_14220/g.25697 Transcript_14220/m.25697 type:complete len:195 (-) Transcript_14220:646-1230(-)